MTDDTQLIHRLNRVQGQIEALRRRLLSEEPMDCTETLHLIKAANNALKKFGEAYVGQHMQACLRQDMPRQELEAKLQEVVSAAFYL